MGVGLIAIAIIFKVLRNCTHHGYLPIVPRYEPSFLLLKVLLSNSSKSCTLVEGVAATFPSTVIAIETVIMIVKLTTVR